MKTRYFVSVIWSVVVAGGLVLGSHTAKAQSAAPDAEKSACPRTPKSEQEKSACELLIRKYPKHADLYFNIGNYFGDTKNDKETARVWAKQGIQANPNYYSQFHGRQFGAS
jgi:hypothetical protein